MSAHAAYVGVTRNQSFWGALKSVPVQCTVSLSCGFIAPYVAPAELEKVRAWQTKDAKE
jgi:hypothetical protein